MPSHIYLFHGDEDFIIDQKIKEIKKKISNPSMNIEQLDGDEGNYEKIVSALATQPFFGGEKLIVIENIDLKLKVWAGLIDSLKIASPEMIVIFKAVSVSKAARIYKCIDELGEVYEVRAFADWEQDQVISWIIREVNGQGKGVSHQAAVDLQATCGNSLRKLTSEIEKLITYIGDRKNMTGEDVFALASPGLVSSFALLDALGERDLKRSLETFQVLYRNRAPIFPLLSLLASQYRTMLQITIGDKTIRANPYFIRKCREKAKRFNREELSRNLELLLETGLKLKSGESQLTTIELLFTSLCGK
ncbi:MAG: DNA polymerase III subunit delta [Candidatus Margulisiibacteriota bacterium]|nr:DNA polymerase III subunit delta [Candidatus Margulisiibacteriota bacterium]